MEGISTVGAAFTAKSCCDNGVSFYPQNWAMGCSCIARCHTSCGSLLGLTSEHSPFRSHQLAD